MRCSCDETCFFRLHRFVALKQCMIKHQKTDYTSLIKILPAFCLSKFKTSVHADLYTEQKSGRAEKAWLSTLCGTGGSNSNCDVGVCMLKRRGTWVYVRNWG